MSAQVTLSITTDAGRAAKLLLALAEQNVVAETPDVQQAEDKPKPKPKRASRSRKKAEPKKAAPEVSAESMLGEDAPAVSMDDLKVAGREHIEAHGVDSLQKVFESLGIKRISDVKPADYATALQQLRGED